MRLSCILLLSAIFLSSTVSGSFSADLDITVGRDGIVTITGDSDHPTIKPGVYDVMTSKKDGYWVLNISSSERFDEYRYVLNMPEGSKINYLGVYDVGGFEEEDGFRITGKAVDKPFVIIVQYRIGLLSGSYAYLIALPTIFSIILLYHFFRRRGRARVYVKDQFSDREYQVIKCLRGNKGCLTQAELERLTGLPKASLSRTILSLEDKKIIEKNKTGMTNKIRLLP
ncbi:helix-turn-helix transcriptional regulator [Candidatus Altiarchaeota archaeon]